MKLTWNHENAYTTSDGASGTLYQIESSDACGGLRILVKESHQAFGTVRWHMYQAQLGEAQAAAQNIENDICRRRESLKAASAVNRALSRQLFR